MMHHTCSLSNLKTADAGGPGYDGPLADEGASPARNLWSTLSSISELSRHLQLATSALDFSVNHSG
jgi:hypothetical protein